MPRLVGKRSDTGANISVLIILAAIVGVALESIGIINVIPGFGRDGGYNPFQDQQNQVDSQSQTSNQPVVAQADRRV